MMQPQYKFRNISWFYANYKSSAYCTWDSNFVPKLVITYFVSYHWW